MFLVKGSDNDSCMCTCCWGALAPVWPQQHKHANKSLSLVLQGEDKSPTPAATPGSTLLCIITQLGVEQRGNGDKKKCKTFHCFVFFPGHGWSFFCQMSLTGSADDGNMLFFHLRFGKLCQLSARMRSRGRLGISEGWRLRGTCNSSQERNLWDFQDLTREDSMAQYLPKERQLGRTVTHPIQ